MKILFIYKFCSKGGVEQVIRNRLDMLKKELSYVKADVLFLEDYGGTDLFESDDILIENDLQKIKELISVEKYDVLINIDTPEVFETLKKYKMILEVHTHYAENRKYLKELKKTDHNIVALTVPSNYFKDVIENEICDIFSIEVVPNFIGPRFMEEYRNLDNIDLSGARRTVGWAGRLDDLKNWKEFLNISKMILEERSDVNFLLVGGANSQRRIKKELYNYFKKYKLLPHIMYLPYYKHMPIFYDYLSRTNGTFVSTSRGESFGMTVLESMSCKCPVVTSDIGAFREILCNGRFGEMYSLGNISSAIHKINEIIDNTYTRNQKINSANEYVMRTYDPSNIMTNWVSFIEKFI